jgi:c(7)-type cytochrome triheme protein
VPASQGKGDKKLGKKFYQTSIIFICILVFIAIGVAFAQKKVGGGDIKFEAKGSTGPVLFTHDFHVNQQKLKCTDCHTKIFKMKKEDLKMTKAAHGQDKHCGVCHNGKKAFSQANDADCAKCHKK